MAQGRGARSPPAPRRAGPNPHPSPRRSLPAPYPAVLSTQEDSQPGESSGTYAILENGKLVGMVQRYSASGAPLRRQMGRRAGPSDDVLPPHAERLANRVKARMDLVGAIHDQLLATGCPFARQMALARMQAAAAAQGLVPGDGDELALPGAKLFGEPEPEDGEAEHPPVGDSRGPHMMMMMRGQDEVEEQEAGPGPWATREEREAFLKAHPAFPRPGMMREPDFDDALPDPAEHPAFPRPLMWREADAAEAGQGPAFDPLAHPAFPRPLIMRDGSEREWRSLANTAMPGARQRRAAARTPAGRSSLPVPDPAAGAAEARRSLAPQPASSLPAWPSLPLPPLLRVLLSRLTFLRLPAAPCCLPQSPGWSQR